jgi:membrane protein YdbS with pleckstrin-like domain
MNYNNSLTRTNYPLHLRKIIKKTISQVLFSILVIAFIGIMIWSSSSEFLEIKNLFSGLVSFVIKFPVPIVLLGIILSAVYQYWYFITYYYELGEDYVTIRKGPITPTEVVISYDKIQDVYVDQDILDRIFGIYDVHISTATVSSGIHAHIDGVLKGSAFGLRDQFLAEVKKRKSSNTI